MQASSLIILGVVIMATVVGLASFPQLVTVAIDHCKDSNTSKLADEIKMVKEEETHLERPVGFRSLIARRWTKDEDEDEDPCSHKPTCVNDAACGTVLDTSDNNRLIYCLCDTNEFRTYTCFDPARGPAG